MITPSGAGLSTAFTSISNLLWPLFAVYRDFETAEKKKLVRGAADPCSFRIILTIIIFNHELSKAIQSI